MCVASLGWGKGCIRFLHRLDQNSGFHGNRKRPLTYNGENNISTFSLFWSDLLQTCRWEDRQKIWNEFKFRPDRTTPYGVRCPWPSKKFLIRLIIGKWCLHKLECSLFIRSSWNLLVTRTGIKPQTSSNSGQIDWVSHFGVTCPWGRIKFSTDLLGNLQDKLANTGRILYVSSVGWGKCCF